ncbi:MAG TPA: hypothetical protein VHT28_02830, partial [Silvibacterium sp.]|nr:hypothetical protein [Silvibacterium sp.]
LDALAEAASVLGNDEWAAIARNGLQVCVDQLTTAHQGVSLEAKGRPKSAAADCELLAALASWLPATLEQPAVFSLVQQVLTFFKADGMISDLAPGFRAGTDHDILPGVALVALGRYARHAGSCNEAAHLEEQLAWYRRRFRLCRSWAMIGWQMQGWSVLWDVAAVRGARDFVFEMADWAISLQLDKNGAFLTDLAVAGPSFHTACVAEGVVEAWRLAAAAGQSERAERYANSWRRSIDFMGSLTVEEIDGDLLPNPRRALGGVRPSLSDSRLRIDYSAHLLRALVRGMALMEHSF